MNALLRSEKITLVSNYGSGECVDELWQLFRRTAVEPCQASSPEFFSFADECLLCARIVLNSNTPDSIDARGAECNESHTDEGHAPQGRSYTLPPPSSVVPPPPSSLPNQEVGFIYLYAGPANLPAGEANIGVIIRQRMRGSGYAREAVQLVLRWAFEELRFHRVQAAILDAPFKDRALRLFIGSGFVHEGTKRRAVYQPEGEGMAGVWKDVTYLAILDTEWVLKSAWKRDNQAREQPIVTVWDEMFTRHAREREGLLQWEENHGRVRKSSSTETLRENMKNVAQDIGYLTDDASSIGDPSLCGSPPLLPRSNVAVTWEGDAYMMDDYGADELSQGWEEVLETTIRARRNRQDLGDSPLRRTPRGHMLSLPSIPSPRVSEVNLQSPLTIPTPSTPEASLPPSPSPSASPSAYDPWSDSEDEADWLFRGTPLPTDVLAQPTVSHVPYPPAVPTSLRNRFRSASISSSSTDSWSDAQSSVSTSSSRWDMLD